MVNPKVEVLAPSENEFYSSAATATAAVGSTAADSINESGGPLPPLQPLKSKWREGENVRITTAATNTTTSLGLIGKKAPFASAPLLSSCESSRSASCHLFGQQQTHGPFEQQVERPVALQLPSRSLFPIYPPVAGVPTKVLKDGIGRLLSMVAHSPDVLPAALIRKRQLLRTPSTAVFLAVELTAIEELFPACSPCATLPYVFGWLACSNVCPLPVLS